MNHVCLPLPPCPRGSMERGGGTPPGLVMGRGRLPPLSSLRRGGGRSLPGLSRTPKMISCHLRLANLGLKSPLFTTWTIGEEIAKTVLPLLPPPPQPRAKGKREERERAIDHTRATDFHEKSAMRRSPPRERLQPHGRDRRSAPARPRSPTMRALPAGVLRIHWGLIRPYDAHAEFGEACSSPAGPSIPPQLCRRGQPIFMKNPPGAAPLLGSAHDRRSAPAPPPPPPPMQALPTGGFKHPLGPSTPL